PGKYEPLHKRDLSDYMSLMSSLLGTQRPRRGSRSWGAAHKRQTQPVRHGTCSTSRQLPTWQHWSESYPERNPIGTRSTSTPNTRKNMISMTMGATRTHRIRRTASRRVSLTLERSAW